VTSQADIWTLFVGDGLAVSTALAGTVAQLTPDVPEPADVALLDRLSQQAFSVAAQALLVGASDVGLLALSIEKVMNAVARSELNPALAIPLLASGTETLRQAFETLANPDESGARIEGKHVEAARFELDTLLPLPGGGRPDAGQDDGYDVAASALTRHNRETDVPGGARSRRETEVPGGARSKRETEVPFALETGSGSSLAPRLPAVPPPATLAPVLGTGAGARADANGERWQPTVDSDMVELFFDEVRERLDDLAVKLLEIEGRPGDENLVTDIFRDLHTVKGSSAMVGLEPMNRLAHAAEDLVGQVRDRTRTIDSAAIDALLACLDGLRSIADAARAGQGIAIDTAPLIDRLRNPNAAVASQPSGTLPPAPVSAPAERTVKQTIRVDFDKLDRLMNLVGELVLGRDGLRGAVRSVSAIADELGTDRAIAQRARSGLGARSIALASSTFGDELRRVERVLAEISAELDASSEQIDSVSGELREQVMKLRMVPIGGIFRKHHRTVRDLGHSTGKQISLDIAGEDTELDKLLVESLDEPLMHLIRNAVDHGIEPPQAREAAGKPAQGSIRLCARHQGNQVVVEIADDGRGMDPDRLKARAVERGLLSAAEAVQLEPPEVLELIFKPGFSTAEAVSELSGRGVGMDVVRQTIMTKLKGTIDIESSPGLGSTFTLRMPLTLAIIQVLLVRAGGEIFAIPLDAIVRTLSRRGSDIGKVGTQEVIEVQGRQVALISIARVLELRATAVSADEPLHVILTEVGGELFGLVCDALVEKKEIVIKPLGALLEGTPCAAGATLLGDRPALILDVPALVRRAQQHQGGAFAVTGSSMSGTSAGTSERPRILLVEDSDTVRESLRRLLVAAGYQVAVARDGLEGLEMAKREHFDLVSTDVMMPRMDGYELTRALRDLDQYRDVPIVMVTSRGERIDRIRGFDAGVDEYITKPHDRHQLVRAVRKLLGETP